MLSPRNRDRQGQHMSKPFLQLSQIHVHSMPFKLLSLHAVPAIWRMSRLKDWAVGRKSACSTCQVHNEAVFCMLVSESAHEQVLVLNGKIKMSCNCKTSEAHLPTNSYSLYACMLHVGAKFVVFLQYKRRASSNTTCNAASS